MSSARAKRKAWSRERIGRNKAWPGTRHSAQKGSKPQKVRGDQEIDPRAYKAWLPWSLIMDKFDYRSIADHLSSRVKRNTLNIDRLLSISLTKIRCFVFTGLNSHTKIRCPAAARLLRSDLQQGGIVQTSELRRATCNSKIFLLGHARTRPTYTLPIG